MSNIIMTAMIGFMALGPSSQNAGTDPYAHCGYFHWASIAAARLHGDHERIQDHLDRLGRLARALALGKGISQDGAHAVLRRSGEALRSSPQGSRLFSINDSGKVCGALQRAHAMSSGALD